MRGAEARAAPWSPARAAACTAPWLWPVWRSTSRRPSKERLVREANFPRPKRLEDFVFAENPNVTPELVGTLADPAWAKANQPLCLIGDSGTGKSHLLIGIGTAIAEAGFRVCYTTTVNLVNELAEAADERKPRPHHRPLGTR
ncbi:MULTISPECIES: ATP-binding protein [unclassified Streptomyces]|uniref:ATP-binding protein n=1 Tax=unclassified Streptomyces TaxID=2593676 RepID=UPI002DDB08AF|nr:MULTISPECIES: ATP-binding protein [unclassified Streptomyces]